MNTLAMMPAYADERGTVGRPVAAFGMSRSTNEPQRYYTPPRGDAGARPYRPRPQETMRRTDARREPVELSGGNVITVSSASGGVGTSTIAALLARALADHHAPAALVDADVRMCGGGLDVLLGIEHEHGSRWHDVHAPLGQLSGTALYRQLPKWDKVRVLAYNPWNGEAPKPWEVDAAVHALAACDEVVVVDAGPGETIAESPTLIEASHVVVVELSVLGLARGRAHLDWLERQSQESVDRRTMPPGPGQPSRPVAEHPGDVVAVVVVEPHGPARLRGVVDVAEARSYLDRDVIGTIHNDAKLCGDILEGLGVRAVPKRNALVIDRLVRQVEHACELRGTLR